MISLKQWLISSSPLHLINLNHLISEQNTYYVHFRFKLKDVESQPLLHRKTCTRANFHCNTRLYIGFDEASYTTPPDCLANNRSLKALRINISRQNCHARLSPCYAVYSTLSDCLVHAEPLRSSNWPYISCPINFHLLFEMHLEEID